MKQCIDACNKELEITTLVTLLRENDSLSGYAWKRLSQYFEKPPSAKRRRQQSHAPSFANVTFDKQNDSGYAWKRLSQYFEKPPSAKRR